MASLTVSIKYISMAVEIFTLQIFKIAVFRNGIALVIFSGGLAVVLTVGRLV